MTATLCVQLWAQEGCEEALAGYSTDPRRADLGGARDAAIARTEIIRVDLV